LPTRYSGTSDALITSVGGGLFTGQTSLSGFLFPENTTILRLGNGSGAFAFVGQDWSGPVIWTHDNKIRSNGTLQLRNPGDTADGNVSCGNLTATSGTASHISAGVTVGTLGSYGALYGSNARFASGGLVTWSSVTTNPIGANADLTFSRNAAGVGQIGTTGANALGSLLLTNLTASGTVLANTVTTTQNGFDLILKPITGATSHGVIIQAQGGAEVMRSAGSGNPRMLVGYGITYGEDPTGAKLQAYAASSTSIPLAVCNWLGQTADTLALSGVSATNTRRQQAAVNSAWADSTDATRTGRLTLGAYSTTTLQEGIRIDANSGGVRLGFYGVTAVARPTLPDAGTVTAADIRTALISLGLCQ
jgi:hypothetical protein